ncbi:hypothetical protein AAFF_G00329160 [Aldrovandia affinis]|uniref:Uncharacterized protein n=1 Tax=Aldrovandia affinis TaxID=143900 RepID=A0AAD7SM62_9TELE|nr:hypothetical protein AAFF_G00329160 [Aldrovandia affinis]
MNINNAVITTVTATVLSLPSGWGFLKAKEDSGTVTAPPDLLWPLAAPGSTSRRVLPGQGLIENHGPPRKPRKPPTRFLLIACEAGIKSKLMAQWLIGNDAPGANRRAVSGAGVLLL